MSEKDKADEDSSSTAGIRHYVAAASLCRASARPLPSSACLHLSSLRDGIISDIRSSVGPDSISTATRLRDGDRSSYWHTNNHAAPELGRSVELLNFDITHCTLFRRRCMLTLLGHQVEISHYRIKRQSLASCQVLSTRENYIPYSSQYQC